jgi:non-specific serine/threonine protein kinase
VFPDSFPLDAAESVAATDEADVLETLGHLVDKSLVLALPGTTYRYRMLETIRQYGRDRLLEHDEPDDAHSRLLAWIMTLIVQLEQDMRTPRQDAALRAVLPERSNARYALEWAIEHDDLGDALRITSTVPLMVTSQRRTLLEQLLDQSPDLTEARRAQVLITLGNLAMEQGRFEETAHFTQEAADIFARLGDERHHAWARYFQVFGLWGKPEAEEDARHLAHEMVNSFRHLNDNFGLAYALWVASQFAHEPEEAQNDARESEHLFRQLDARFGLAHALEGRALVALKNDTTAGTEPVLAEALTILADAENLGCTAHCLEAIAAVLALNDRLEDAAVLLGAAQNLRDEVGQEHRAWEREGQRRTQQAFDQSQHRENLDRAQAHGRTLTFLEAVERAHSLLNPHDSAHPDSTPTGAQASHRRPAMYGDP